MHSVESIDAQRHKIYVYDEINIVYFDVHILKPEVFRKVFKDNLSCIFVTQPNRFLPHKKHITIKYHQFGPRFCNPSGPFND